MWKSYYKLKVGDSKEEPAHNQAMIDAMDRWILECQLNLTPYNDGWSLEHYKKELEKAKKIRESWGTQLQIPFPESSENIY